MKNDCKNKKYIYIIKKNPESFKNLPEYLINTESELELYDDH